MGRCAVALARSSSSTVEIKMMLASLIRKVDLEREGNRLR
jgi:hypothetical protein